MLWLAYDSSMLKPALELAKTRRLVAVLNPDDGPGKIADADFSRFVSDSKKLPNIRVVGYVDLVTWGSSWKLKTSQQLASERDAWSDLYGVSSFWLDDCFPDNGAMRDLTRPFTASAGSSFVNAGENVPSGHWMRGSGFTVCDFEDPVGAKTWAKASGPCMILFTTRDAWRSAFEAAGTKGAKFIGIEDVARHHSGEFQKPFGFWSELR